MFVFLKFSVFFCCRSIYFCACWYLSKAVCITVSQDANALTASLLNVSGSIASLYFIEIFIIFLTYLPLHAKISINKDIPLSFLRYTAELNRISPAAGSLTGILQFFIIPTVIAAAGNSRLPGPVRSVCFQKA